MKGIILAGGAGSRLKPLTDIVSKQLLPVYNKPMIYYPISTLMLAGIREIAVISTPRDINLFKQSLGSGDQFGVKFSYFIQEEPKGLPDAFNVVSDWLGDSSSCLILGDNIFYGPGLGRQLSGFIHTAGAHAFGYQVRDPERFGVIELDGSGNVLSMEEKPAEPKSSYALTGLYFFDSEIAKFVEALSPSPRGELEILDLLKSYRQLGALKVSILPRGTAWLDTGTFESLHDAGTFIKIIEERTGLAVGDPIDVAKNQGWIK